MSWVPTLNNKVEQLNKENGMDKILSTRLFDKILISYFNCIKYKLININGNVFFTARGNINKKWKIISGIVGEL